MYGGEPLAVAFAGHLGAFLTALGPRFDLMRRDPAFVEAAAAIDAIAGAESALSRGDAEAARRVLAAHERLCAFDAGLGQLTARLQHTVIDGALLQAIVDDVVRELGEAPVAIMVTPPARGVAVECYRFDLSLVLRNLVRNAAHAAAAGPAPARVALDVDRALEPTGEEIARVRVRDTNPSAVPPPAQLIEARGLALVRAALQRCDGSLSVEPAGDGFAKSVVVRLFCAMHAQRGGGMSRLVVIEDGDEYAEFARVFLADLEIASAHSAADAMALLRARDADVLLIDLRFDRAPPEVLVGDVAGTAARLFAGDSERALRYLQDEQGTLILAALRAAGFAHPALFVHDFPPRRLANLRRLYGDVDAVPSLDAAAIRRALGRGR